MKLIATTDALAYGLTEAYHMALMLMHRYGRLRDGVFGSLADHDCEPSSC